LVFEPVSGRATVYSYSVVVESPTPRLEAPYTVIIAELEEQGGRRGDAIVGQGLGDRSEPSALSVEGEDLLHDGAGDGVGFEAVKALAGGGFGGVRMRPGVGEAVAGRRGIGRRWRPWFPWRSGPGP
jgi:hypothetical protein